jgi:hypothetical protein
LPDHLARQPFSLEGRSDGPSLQTFPCDENSRIAAEPKLDQAQLSKRAEEEKSLHRHDDPKK